MQANITANFFYQTYNFLLASNFFDSLFSAHSHQTQSTYFCRIRKDLPMKQIRRNVEDRWWKKSRKVLIKDFLDGSFDEKTSIKGEMLKRVHKVTFSTVHFQNNEV